MKKTLCIALVLFSAMLLIPLTSLKTTVTDTLPTSAAAAVKIPKAKNAASDKFKVLNSDTGEITEIKAEDYIFGVVAAEMPALYSEEALKAQAVAAYTYACRRRAENSAKTYDITTDYTTDQSYISSDALKEKWGENTDKYTEKIRSAVESVSGYMVTYEGSPALTVYHAISAGRTETAENVWGCSYPYLCAVDSPGDKLSPDYISALTISRDELASKLGGAVSFTGEPSEYFGKTEKTDSGMVKEILICGESVRGAKIRSLLNLRSSFFDVQYSDGSFTFTVYGYGHGVGMSQNGANYMAKQGSDFKEILTTYYPGCKVQKIK